MKLKYMVLASITLLAAVISTPAEVINLANLKQRLSAAEKANDQQGIRYWTNVIYLQQNLRKTEVQQVKCGKIDLPVDPDANTKDKLLTELPPGVLKALFPALGGDP